MEMHEAVCHPKEKAIFFPGVGGGVGRVLLVMRALSTFSDSFLHSCYRTEEMKFSNKQISGISRQNPCLF